MSAIVKKSIADSRYPPFVPTAGAQHGALIESEVGYAAGREGRATRPTQRSYRPERLSVQGLLPSISTTASSLEWRIIEIAGDKLLDSMVTIP